MTTATATRPITLAEIGDQAKHLATARNHLASIVNQLTEAIAALKADAHEQLLLHIDACNNEWWALEAMIQAQPELFVKPRTVSMHGIKFGIEKGKGAIEIEDEARTVKLIRKNLPEMADVLIKTTSKPVKKAIGGLTGAQLKSVGVVIGSSADQVVIRPEDGGVDKLVKTLLGSAVQDEEDPE